MLAHAPYPEDGRVHFDEDETFTDSTVHGTSLLYIAVHELGHALGLAHSNVPNAVMAPAYSEGMAANLRLDDINGIQAIYGKHVCIGQVTSSLCLLALCLVMYCVTNYPNVFLLWVLTSYEVYGSVIPFVICISK